jgi:hypothetical protein
VEQGVSDWKIIPKFKDYEINSHGLVRYKGTSDLLMRKPIGNTFTYVLVDNQGNPKKRVVDSLLKATFGGEEDEV